MKKILFLGMPLVCASSTGYASSEASLKANPLLGCRAPSPLRR